MLMWVMVNLICVMPLMSGAAKMGMDFRLIGPKQYWPAGPFYEECLKVAKETGATITCTDNVAGRC